MLEQAIIKKILKEGIVSVYVTFQGPTTSRIIKMAVDTGATFTMIPCEIARDIGYDPVLSKKRVEISTASGMIFTPVIKINSVACLGTKVNEMEVICHDLPVESPVEGLLGLNFLVYVLEFKNFLLKINRFLPH